MELAVEPVAGGVTWRIVYGEGDARSVRDYVLRRDAARPTRWILDERNGIEIDFFLAEDVLYGQFETGSSRIDSRFELAGDRLRVSIVTHAVERPRETGDGAVRSYSIRNVQIADLSRGD